MSERESIKCYYCGLRDGKKLLRCGCGRYFCNGVGEGHISHIVHHIARSTHKELRFPKDSKFRECTIECFLCRCRNPFVLGYIVLRNNPGTKTVICRECRYVETLTTMTDNWDVDSWKPLVQDKKFEEWICPSPSDAEMKFVVGVSGNEMRKKEFEWQTSKKKIRNDYYQEDLHQTYLNYHDCVQYQNTFTPLIKLEANADKNKRESEHLVNIDLKFDDVRKADEMKKTVHATFEVPANEEIRITINDTLMFFLPLKGKSVEVNEIHTYNEMVPDEKDKFFSRLHTLLVGTVQYIRGKDITVQFEKTPGVPIEKQIITQQHNAMKFSICFQWMSIPFKRKKTALQMFGESEEPHDFPTMSSYLRNRLLGMPKNPMDMVYEKDFKDEKEAYLAQHPTLQSMNAPNLPTLNQVQYEVVMKSFTQSLSLIQGPPGTGKTVTSATIIYHAVHSNPGKKVLVCAPSNIAVDQLAAKIVDTGVKVIRVFGKGRESENEPLYDYSLGKIVDDVMAQMKDKETLEKYKAFREEPEELAEADKNSILAVIRDIELKVFRECDVICCTCCVAGDRRLFGINNQIDTVLVDESTQAEEPEVLVCFMNSVRQIFLVGDHCQLGPVLNSKDARKYGLGLPMFSRLLQLGHEPYRLQFQYRMHPALSEFSSHTFYDGVLQNGVTALERQFNSLKRFWFVQNRPMMFVATAGKESFGSTATSYLNDEEVTVIRDIIVKMIDCGVSPEQIGVITPYIAQKQAIRVRLTKDTELGVNVMNAIEIASVDSFQGREKDFIIFSTVRSNSTNEIGFLKNPQRLNVSITRAKYGLVVVGNPSTLSSDPLWSLYLQFFIDHNVLVHGNINNLKPFPLVLEKKKIPIGMYQYTPLQMTYSDIEPLNDKPVTKRNNPNFEMANPLDAFKIGIDVDAVDDEPDLTISEDEKQQEEEEEEDFSDDGYTFM
ncbi:nonsense-mediated mRNA decay protein, putative [Entamoeba invadens IP1]|uniref:Nonsense-mediated mRNA decay protein, putative n=1 Tax=Entamoeba invadens IP1 TaxID=370355 RepID=A0A0A1U1T2_ENTIV|nr:nonsense-mediated mRNA decay protein, putative [Entamoeba invadens IP1]ELP87976.1 nonsense-mediated mRNA decay protein, putative [Entamoeba invadens IP1]|eukprot:XP_004254747.1 nonsense-mediated mRNA decay protein, putative [Entamoeba invadens IP1]